MIADGKDPNPSPADTYGPLGIRLILSAGCSIRDFILNSAKWYEIMALLIRFF